jgi:hypothetical protein
MPATMFSPMPPASCACDMLSSRIAASGVPYMHPHLPHLDPHTRHVLIACVIALVLLTAPAEVLSGIASAAAL